MLKICDNCEKAIAGTSNNKNMVTMETTHCNCSETYLHKPQDKELFSASLLKTTIYW
jgi:hypothetical protein